MYLYITILCYYIINIMAKAAKPGDTSLHKLSQAGHWSKLEKLELVEQGRRSNKP